MTSPLGLAGPATIGAAIVTLTLIPTIGLVVLRRALELAGPLPAWFSGCTRPTSGGCARG